MKQEREIVSDYKQHVVGEREVADWDRLDHEGRVVTHRNVPFIYLREVTAEDYFATHPNLRGKLRPDEQYFWEVSLDWVTTY